MQIRGLISQKNIIYGETQLKDPIMNYLWNI